MDSTTQEYKGIYYSGLKYSTREINMNFKIKVSGQNNGAKLHTLVGVGGYLDIVGNTDVANNLLDMAFKKGKDVVVCRLRRGLKITFYTNWQ